MSFPTRIVLLLASIACTSFSTLAQQATPPASEPASNQSPQNQSEQNPSAPSTPAQSAPAAEASSTQQSSPQQSGAQQSGTPQPAQPKADKGTGDKDKEKEKDKPRQSTSGEGKVAGTSNDRLFYTLPNFLSLENAKNLPPLTTGQKFKVVALGTFDPIQFPWWGLLSAIGQAENSEPGYGQGWESYAKRFGTTAADSTIENFMVGAVFPSMLRQDPRFYELGHGTFTHRTVYAVGRIFVTRTDSGHTQFNYSEIVGSALAATISTYSYHPRSTYLSTPTNPHLFVASDRTLKNTGSVWGTQVALDTITLVVKEFWPDVHRKISKKHNKAVSLQPTGTNP